MVLSKSLSRTCTTFNRKVTVQKVVIPKGSVDPEDTIVIEIPLRMQSIPILLAKRQTPHLQETINSKWNLLSSVNFDEKRAVGEIKSSVRTEKQLSADISIQTSVTEVDKTSQVYPQLSPLENHNADYPYLQQKSSMNFHERRPMSSPIFFGNHVDVMPTEDPSSLGNQMYSRFIKDDGNGNGVPKCSSPHITSENYEWAKHNCNIQHEIANLLDNIESCERIERDNSAVDEQLNNN